jgi:hypothetical protein
MLKLVSARTKALLLDGTFVLLVQVAVLGVLSMSAWLLCATSQAMHPTTQSYLTLNP